MADLPLTSDERDLLMLAIQPSGPLVANGEVVVTRRTAPHARRLAAHGLMRESESRAGSGKTYAITAGGRRALIALAPDHPEEKP